MTKLCASSRRRALATRMSTSVSLATSPVILNTSSASEATHLQVRLGLPLRALPNHNALEFVALEFPQFAACLPQIEKEHLIERLSKNPRQLREEGPSWTVSEGDLQTKNARKFTSLA